MAKVIFFDDIDFELIPGTSGDEVSTSGKWLDNGIYFTNPKSEDGLAKPHHIAHDSYIYTLGSNVTHREEDEYELKTTDSSYYISVISGISANPFKKEIKYSTTKYDLSGIFGDISNMKQQISDILGRLNGQETVSSFTFSLSRTGITDNSFKNFVVGEPILAKITSITPSSAKYSSFNIIESDGIKKIDHTATDEDACYFNKEITTSVSAYVITGSENSQVSSTIDNVTVNYAAIYTYAYSCGVRVAGLGNININTTSNISLQSKFTDIQGIIFNKLKDQPVETESNIANKKLSDYYNVNSYKVYYNNSYTTTTGTPSLLTYAIKKQNTPTYINTSVELNVKAYLVSYTVKTEDPDNLKSYTYAYNYAYITDISNATVDQYLGKNKDFYTFKNTCNGKNITGGPVASLDSATNKPHRKDILITYTLNRPTGITVSKGGAVVESSLQLTVGETVELVVTLNTSNNENKLHEKIKEITVSASKNITLNNTHDNTITVTANDNNTANITVTVKSDSSNSSINFSTSTLSKGLSVTTSQNLNVVYKIKSYKGTGGYVFDAEEIPNAKDIGINILSKGTINEEMDNDNVLHLISNIPENFEDLTEDDNPNTTVALGLQSNFEIYTSGLDHPELYKDSAPSIIINNKTYYYYMNPSGSQLYIQLK